MRRLAIVVFVGLLLSGCGKSRPTYELTVGGETFTLAVYEDPKQIQDELIAHVKPLWDALESGTSEPFRFTRVAAWDAGADVQERWKSKYGENVKMSSTVTVKSPSFRFFRNRDGKSGLEQLREGGDPFDRISGIDLRWDIIESHLREQVFSLEDIRLLIQGDLGEQTGTSDTKQPFPVEQKAMHSQQVPEKYTKMLDGGMGGTSGRPETAAPDEAAGNPD
jgi:hypothetical protein